MAKKKQKENKKQKKTEEKAPAAETPVSGTPAASTPEQDAADFERYKAIVDKQIGEGREFGEEIADKYFKEGSMGRMATDVNPDVLAAIEMQRQEYERAKQRTAEDQMVLDRRVAGLEGYTAEENAALREAMRQSLTRDYATQQRDMARLASRGNVSAGAAMGQQQGLSQGFMRAGANQGRDLLIANVDEKQKRLNSLSDFVANLDEREFSKRKSTLDAYTGSQNNRQAYQTLAGQYNDTQKNAETAGQVGSVFGGIGSYTGLLGSVKAEDTAQDNQKKVFDIFEENNKYNREAMDAYIKKIGR